MYIDTNIIGYAVENHPKYGAPCKKILMDIWENRMKASASIYVLAELVSVFRKINKQNQKIGQKKIDAREHIEATWSLPIEWIELKIPIIKLAATYDYDIHGADYIHVSTMHMSNITEIISADTDFDNIPGIKRIDPLEYGKLKK
jgi:predicted nucleic acid-binding protein